MQSCFYSVKTSKFFKNSGACSITNYELSSQFFLERLRHRGEDCEQIADNAISCGLEDWGISIFVDGYNEFGISHADQMLDRAGDAAGNV